MPTLIVMLKIERLTARRDRAAGSFTKTLSPLWFQRWAETRHARADAYRRLPLEARLALTMSGTCVYLSPG